MEPNSTIEFSEKIEKIVPALIEVLPKMVDPPKTLVGYEQAYSYASLLDILKEIRPLLAEAKLALMQPITNSSPELVTVSSIILHASGQYVRTTASMPPVKVPKGGAGQAFGAAVSYLRRYSLTALFSIAEHLDLDGTGEVDEEAEKRKLEAQKRAQRQRQIKQDNGNGRKKAPPPEMSEKERIAQVAALVEDAKQCTTKDEARAVFVLARDKGLLTEQTPAGKLGEVIKAAAEALPDLPPAPPSGTH